MYKREKVLIPVLGAVLYLSFFGLTRFVHAEEVTVPASSMPSNPIYVNGKIYFIAYPNQPEPFSRQLARLWSTDGTSEGTRMLMNVDVDSTKTCSGPALVARNDRLIFAAKDESSGKELWFYDVKTQEAGLIKDIYPGKTDSLPCMLANANGTIVVFAFDNQHRASLWTTDGTPSGTVKIKENLSPRPLQWPVVIGNTVFFVANDDVHGFELWKSDGTSAGTVLVKDIAPGAANSNIGSTASVGKTVYFSADDGTTGKELWKSDGTPDGTVLVKDLIPGKAGSNPHSLTNVGNVLHFGGEPDGWWKSDGTSKGTVKVDKQLFVEDFITLKHSLLVVGREDENSEIYALWKASPDTGRLEMIKEFVDFGLSFVVFNNLLYFSADDCKHGEALWKSDGTSAGTLLVSDINGVETQDTLPIITDLTVAGDTLFFDGNDGIHGTELWKTDGTEKGTLMVKDLATGSGKVQEIPPPPDATNVQSPCQKLMARPSNKAALQGPKAGASHEPTQPEQKKAELSNQDIIDLVKAGLNEENLIARIEAARSVEFDLSPDQLKNLLAQRVSNRIIAAMQKRQAGAH